MKKIIITGGEGRFAKTLKKNFIGKNIYYLSKKEFNILNFKSMENMIKKIKPKIIIHLAALSSPTSVHNDNISKSIDINIIGTCNLVKICEKFNIKLIHMSTHYVYPGKKGNYLETDSLLPGNNYSWSKLGGECAVQMYLKNSLIIRVAMYEVPFIHKYAFINRKSNFLTHEEVAKIIPKLLNAKGVINIGGKRCSIYKFALKTNKKVLPKKYIASENVVELMPDTSVNINKLKSILKE
mgnify:CR=1 FL=1